MKVESLQVSEYTPLMLPRMETLPTPEIRATARHDHSTTATVNTHMTVVTTGGQEPEMGDQESDTRTDS